jgi:energy-coupling factor transport system permease protein
MPLLIDEVRTLMAVRRLRATHRERSRQDWRLRIGEPLALLGSALVVAVRRGDELAEAVDARGGLGRFADDDRWLKVPDVIVLVLVAAAAAAVFLI